MSFTYTILLYIMIFFLTTFLASKTQKRDRSGAILYSKIYLYLSFIIHWVFLAFTNIGVDYKNYVRIINRLNDMDDVLQSSEIGFSIICYLLNNIFNSPDIVIFLIKTLTLLLFYYGFLKIISKVEICIVVLTFNLFLYLQGFFIIGMQLNISLIFLSFIFLLENKKIKSFILLVIAISVHSTGFFFIPLYIMYIFTNKKKRISIYLIFVLAISYFLIYLFSTNLFYYFINNIPQLRQYQIYKSIDVYSGSGIMQYIYFLPVFYFVLLIYFNCNDTRYINLTILTSLTAFLFAMLGYKFDVLARINKSFFAMYSLLIPMYFHKRKYSKLFLKNYGLKFDLQLDMLIWKIYIIFRGYDFICEYLSIDSSADIREYVLFWPFK